MIPFEHATNHRSKITNESTIKDRKITN